MMESFDVKPLFTNVTLETTIDIILEKISEWDEINTFISQTEMKRYVLKSVHFIYNNIIYQLTDRVAMVSPLGPVLAGIFITKLEIQ